jgi:shikimate kinase
VSHVVLLGLMGTGKTQIGRRVAERLGRPLLDCDDLLEAQMGGRTARQIAEAEGLDHLHELEARIALEMIASADPAVIGPAASTIEVDAVRDASVGHTVVWLTGPVELLAEKAAGKDHRPLVHERDVTELIEEQLRDRQPLALAIADLVIDISIGSRDDQTEQVLAFLNEAPGSGR